MFLMIENVRGFYLAQYATKMSEASPSWNILFAFTGWYIYKVISKVRRVEAAKEQAFLTVAWCLLHFMKNEDERSDLFLATIIIPYLVQ